MTEKLNLVETIANNDKFSTFSRMIGTSKAADLFSGPGPFTVFVPTNDAFAKVPDDQMNSLLKEENQPKLKALLSYHIVPGKLMAANLASLGRAKTTAGPEVQFSDSNGLAINGSKLQARNIEATNGVIHVIDTVLSLPAAVAGSVTR